METKTKQPTVREINAHVFAGVGSCYVQCKDGVRFRISRAKTKDGQVLGRVINSNVHWTLDWEVIPPNATIELH